MQIHHTHTHCLHKFEFVWVINRGKGKWKFFRPKTTWGLRNSSPTVSGRSFSTDQSREQMLLFSRYHEWKIHERGAQGPNSASISRKMIKSSENLHCVEVLYLIPILFARQNKGYNPGELFDRLEHKANIIKETISNYIFKILLTPLGKRNRNVNFQWIFNLVDLFIHWCNAKTKKKFWT